MARFYWSRGQIPRLLPDIPSPLDIILHYPHLSHFPPGRSPIALLLSVHRVSAITPFTHEQPLWQIYPQSKTSTSVVRILWSPSPAISPQVARCPLITGLYARCHADRFSHPTDPVLNKYFVATIFTRYSSLAPEPPIAPENVYIISPLLPCHFPPLPVDPTNDCLLQVQLRRWCLK
jgi:hypothetical protein